MLKQIQRPPVVADSWSPSLQTLEGHSGTVSSVAFSPDGLTLVSGSGNKTIKLWDTTTGTHRQTLEGHLDWIRLVAFSPDGLTLASCSEDNTIKLWNTTTGIHQQTLEGHSSRVYSVAFSLDGFTLASASNDETIKLWDTTTGTHRQTLEGHPSDVNSVLNKSNCKVQVSLSNAWIALDGENLLWLPAEYRSSKCFAVKDATLALGYHDGRVTIIGFRAL
ncbi:WD40 repeat domain-containing protein [Aspergillus alliaceus]|uniref:WD40 repeat domain-containing protein n=1 Tax=Petromyces alliaceus TaxID=209559 RepID=UPI0012A6EF36|nr:WD40-repeat-containing domain protein [Aspergillus alliaceus]KAB8238294.1 WD40-repeat-containing domain protein [Aspergillus alliaceus]